MIVRIFSFLIVYTLYLPSHSFAQDIFKLLPKNNELKGWTYKSEPRLFANNQLWEYIDGGADVYIDYGFQKVATVELENAKRNIVVDIYDMKSLEGAFGMYARERARTYHFISMGAGGYHEGVALNFYQSSYYVKLTAFTDDPPSQAALLKLAQLVSQKIGANKKPPSELTLFLEKNKIKYTENYDAKSFLDRTELRESYSAKYKVDGKEFTLFFCKAQSASIALSRFNGLQSMVTQKGSFDKDFIGVGEKLLTGKHREAGEIMLSAKGNYLFGAFPIGDGKKLKAVLLEVMKGLK